MADQNIIKVQSASRANYEGMLVLSQFDRDGRGEVADKVFLGKAERYDGIGGYDNSDGSLVYISDNRKMFSFLDANEGWVVSQQALIESGDFSAEDYAEFARLKETVLAQYKEVKPKLFGIDLKAWDGGKFNGVPFRYPDWQTGEERAKEETDMAQEQINLNEMPIEEIATLDYVNNPDRRGTGGVYRASAILKEVIGWEIAGSGEELRLDALYKRYDDAWTKANLKDDFKPKIAILQLREGEENHNRRFLGMDSLNRIMHEEPDCDNYELVYVRNEVLEAVHPESVREKQCNELYGEFNFDGLRPRDYYGHSLSVGDVIVFANDFNEHHAYFVDNVCFKKLPDEFLTHTMAVRIRNDLDIREEGALYESISHYQAEHALPIMDEAAQARYFQITSEYARIFELADRRGMIMDMDALGFGYDFAPGGSVIYWQAKGEAQDRFATESWADVRNFIDDIKTLQETYSLEQLQDIAAHDYDYSDVIPTYGERKLHTAIATYPQREQQREQPNITVLFKDEKNGLEAGINADGNLYFGGEGSGYNLPDTIENRQRIEADIERYTGQKADLTSGDYRFQVQTIYEYEEANNIPENDRMTKWSEDYDVSVAKPWYKENDPSVMDRALADRHIGISEALIAQRFAEIRREQTIQNLWDMVNSAETVADVSEAEKVLRDADISNDDYNELMMALSAQSREAYRENRRGEPIVTMEIAKQLINDFCLNEYGSEANFDNLKEVGIAYTTVEDDDQIPIQANVNLVDFRIERYLDNRLIETRQYGSLAELVSGELEDLDFNDLTSVSEEEIALVKAEAERTAEISRGAGSPNHGDNENQSFAAQIANGKFPRLEYIAISDTVTGWKDNGAKDYGEIPGYVRGYNIEFMHKETGEINYNGALWVNGTIEGYYQEQMDAWGDLGYTPFEMERFNGWEPTGKAVMRGYAKEEYDIEERETFVVTEGVAEEIEQMMRDNHYVLKDDFDPHRPFAENVREQTREERAADLAYRLDELSREIDTYGYQDAISADEREAHRAELARNILDGNVADYTAWVEDAVNDGSLTDEQKEIWAELKRDLLSFSEERQDAITFYVAEVMEFPNMGEYHERLTLKEALDLYEQIPAERMNGGKGIGFELHDGSIYDGMQYALMQGTVVQEELINGIEHYRNSPLVQKAIQDCKDELARRNEREQSASNHPKITLSGQMREIEIDHPAEEPLVDISNLAFDDEGYLHFTVTADGYELEGLYRVLDPANGEDMELVGIDYGEQHPIIERQWSRIEDALYDASLDRYNALIDKNFEHKDRVIQAMALAGYVYNEQQSADGRRFFDGGTGGISFVNFAEADRWIEGYVALSDDDKMYDEYQHIMYPERYDLSHLTDYQRRTVQAMEVVGYEYDATANMGAVGEIVFRQKDNPLGYPIAFRTWDEARDWIDGATFTRMEGGKELLDAKTKILYPEPQPLVRFEDVEGKHYEYEHDLYFVADVKDGVVYLQNVNNDYHTEIPEQRFIARAVDVTERDRLWAENPVGERDWYFNSPERGEVFAVHFNPDSYAGGQYVQMYIPYELILEAAKENSSEAFFDLINERAKQELVDIDTPEFKELMEHYKTVQPDFVYESGEFFAEGEPTMRKLIEIANDGNVKTAISMTQFEKMPNHYYEPDLGLSGTADELFIQARNGYIENPEALAKLQEILSNPVEQKTEQAFYVGILKEIAEDKGEQPYVFAQMKKDILDGVNPEEVQLREGLTLEVMRYRDSIVIDLREDTAERSATGGFAASVDRFLNMNAQDFERAINEVYAHNMVEQEREENEREHEERSEEMQEAEPIMVKTNMGEMPVEDYREIVAQQHGFDSYDEMYAAGVRIGNGYDKEPEEQLLHAGSDNIKVEGHKGTWYVIETNVIEGRSLFLLEHEEYGDEAACIIVDEHGKLVMDDVWNGFDDYEEQREMMEDHHHGDKGNPSFAADNAEQEELKRLVAEKSAPVEIDSTLAPKDQLKQRLENGVRSVLDSENFKNWLSTGGKLFYNNYSFRNAMLVWLQKPDASYVMGYEKWKDFGRNVKQGAVGAKVFVPLMANEKFKGALFRSIKSNLSDQLSKDPSLEVASYTLGSSNLEFTMNRANHAIGFKVKDVEQQIFGSDDEVKRFIDRAIIGKVPTGFTVGTVFDAKDVAAPEHLWVRSGFTKEEVVTDEKGNPIKNKRGETKIVNTPERQARFQPDLDTRIAAKDPEKMQKLFEACVAASERKGVPVSLAEKGEDETLNGGAKGYFSRAFTEDKPNGFIVIDNSLEITEKCAVLLHEMGHADLHKNLDALAKKMGEEKIPKAMREVQAEAVAFSVASTFGLETDTSSFNYLAAYSRGFELQDFQKSLDVIYRESQALTADIKAELDIRGLNLDLTEKPKEMLDKETLATLSTKYLDFAKEQGERVQAAFDELPGLIKQSQDNPDLMDVLKYQKTNLDTRRADLDSMLTFVESLNEADTREKQDEVLELLEAAMNRVSGNGAAFEGLSERYVTISEQARGGLKADFDKHPGKTLEAMKKDYPALAALSKPQLQYIAASKFVSRELSKLLRNDPQKFVDKVTERAGMLSKVAAKNGTFVEVSFCEQWTENPIFEQGTLCSPKIADTVVKGSEAQVQGLKAEAEKRGEYFPYVKCDVTVYTPNKDGGLTALHTRVDIGDGAQTGLKDHLEQVCKRGAARKELLANFQEALTERANKNKIKVQDLSEKPQSAELPGKGVIKEGNMTREEWAEKIAAAKEQDAGERSEESARRDKSKSDAERDRR